MIVGNGLIASAFQSSPLKDDPNIVVFASGVSNSRETSKDEFLRERQLLLETINQGKLILYFSTCSVYDPSQKDAPYITHKLEMEDLVRQSNAYRIFRLPQVVGLTKNPNTLASFLYQRIRSGIPFEVWKGASRNIIDVAHVASITTFLLEATKAGNTTENIASPISISVEALVTIFESILKKRAICTYVDAGTSYSIDASLSARAAKIIGIEFDDHYVERVLRKYYDNRHDRMSII